jgi:hypothetical protein
MIEGSLIRIRTYYLVLSDPAPGGQIASDPDPEHCLHVGAFISKPSCIPIVFYLADCLHELQRWMIHPEKRNISSFKKLKGK